MRSWSWVAARLAWACVNLSLGTGVNGSHPPISDRLQGSDSPSTARGVGPVTALGRIGRIPGSPRAKRATMEGGRPMCPVVRSERSRHVAELSMRELGTIARNLGHRDLRVVPMAGPGWWRAECGCGYRSTRRTSEAEAADTAVHHVTKIARAFLATARGGGHDISEYLKADDEPAGDISDTPEAPTGEMLRVSA